VTLKLLSEIQQILPSSSGGWRVGGWVWGVTSTAGDGERYVLQNNGHQFHCGIAVRPRNGGCVIAI